MGRCRRALRRLALLATASCLLAAAPSWRESPPVPRKKVLAIHFSMRQAPMLVDVDAALRRELSEGLGDRLDYSTENIDLSRLPDPTYGSAVRTYLRAKYVENPPDVVIATSASIVSFVSRDPLFPDVPVVYATRPGVPAGPRSAGVVSELDLRGTLAAALAAQPATRNVFLVSGTAPGERTYRELLRTQCRDLEARVTFHEITGLSLSEIEDRVRRLPEASIVYYLSLIGDNAGRTYSAVEAVEAIGMASSAPVYAWHEGFFGHGIVGGRLHSAVNDARETGRIAVRVLNGERPESIGARTIDSGVYEFDARQLQRWGIAEAALPAGSTIAFRQPTFFDRYRGYVLGGLLVIGAQLTLIAGLLVQRALRQRAEEALLEATARNSAILRAVPDLMFVFDRNGTYLDYHARNPALLFAPPEVFLGRTILEVMPMPLAQRFMDAIAQVHGASEPVIVEYELALDELRHFEVRILPVDQSRVLAIVREVTESRRAIELNRALAGRLITSQEDERQRIARELHDDMAQRLSLLAVDLGTLARDDSSPAEVRARLSALSSQASELGGDLQRVSHELHPATLKQLGLEVALRAFCRELAQARRLDVDLEARDVPPSLPPDVALCVYRVAQEALQNVARHSGARHAAVTLTGVDGTITLTVADDGAGFDIAAPVEHAALGLTSMRERVRLAGGTLRVDSLKGAGARIEASVPVRDRREA
jgi:signal transduction histidine kinase